MDINTAEIYQVGMHIPEFAYHQCGCCLNTSGNTLILSALQDKPTDKDVSAANIDENGLRLGIFPCENAIFMLAKVGKLFLADAPYTPHLVVPEMRPNIERCKDGEGLPVIYMFVDSSDGEILQMQSFALSTRMSNIFLNCCRELLEREFSTMAYLTYVSDIQQKYLPQQMAKNAQAGMSIKKR